MICAGTTADGKQVGGEQERLVDTGKHCKQGIVGQKKDEVAEGAPTASTTFWLQTHGATSAPNPSTATTSTSNTGLVNNDTAIAATTTGFANSNTTASAT